MMASLGRARQRSMIWSGVALCWLRHGEAALASGARTFEYNSERRAYLGNSTKETFTHIGLYIILAHPLEYIKVSLWHYFNLWSPGGKKIFFDDYLKNKTVDVPFKQELLNASGEIRYEKKIPTPKPPNAPHFRFRVITAP